MKRLTFFLGWLILASHSSVIYAAKGSVPEIKINILTSALGKEGEVFPPELVDFWQPVDINSRKVAPTVKLLRIDLSQEKELAISLPQPEGVIEKTVDLVANLVQADPRSILKDKHDQLEKSAISKDFSNSVPANQNQIEVSKRRYSSESKIFTVAQISSPETNQFLSVNDLLPVLKKQITDDIAKGVNPLKYSVFYKLPAIAEKPLIPPKPPVEKPVTENKPIAEEKPAITNTPKSSTACTVVPVSTPVRPNWYAVIEIGAKGIKPIAVEIKENLDPSKFDDRFDTQDVTPSEEVSIPRVVNAVCDDINQFHAKYGNLPIYIIGSSSMAIVSHRERLVAAIDQAVHKQVDFITAEQEANYLGKGIWGDENLPTHRHCESAVLSIGSGNIKGGYIENCDPKVRQGKDEKFASFEVQKFGTTQFTKQAQQKMDSKTYPTFIDAAKGTREELETKLDEQIRTRPELTNGKKRFYLEGGALWMMSSLLCLDCPQYDHREENTNKQDVFTAIKPKDIDVFYHYVTTAEKDICDPTKENPYLKVDMDGVYKEPLSQKRIDKQKAAIQKVCQKFVPRDLISAAEILEAIKNKMDFDHPDSHIFFMQNNLYTWSRQYLIEKIQKNASQ
jgi:hypothetical protein